MGQALAWASFRVPCYQPLCHLVLKLLDTVTMCVMIPGSRGSLTVIRLVWPATRPPCLLGASQRGAEPKWIWKDIPTLDWALSMKWEPIEFLSACHLSAHNRYLNWVFSSSRNWLGIRALWCVPTYVARLSGIKFDFCGGARRNFLGQPVLLG